MAKKSSSETPPPMRRTGLLIALSAAFALALAPSLADARAGGGASSGSRGSRTYSAPPATRTAPGGVQTFDRSAAQPSSPAVGTSARPGAVPARSGGFFRSFGGALLGGGLIGMLLGYGLFGGGGGFGAVLGLLLQIGLVVILVRLAMRLFARGRSPAMASGPQPGGYAFNGASAAPGGAVPAGRPIEIGPEDYDAFERTLKEVNAAWSRRDLAGLRSLATPEMVGFFAQDLRDLEGRNWRNETRDLRLEQGDLAEAWNEGEEDYATVAMRFSLLDATFDNATNQVVEGSTTARQTVTELWTFVRRGPGGRWLLSAIQQPR